MGAKLPTESGLKAILSKHKIKDNGLQKALAAYEKLGDDAHDECLEQIVQLGRLAAALKKAKEVAANDVVVDFLEGLLDAADTEEKDVAKAKAEAKKTETADQKKAAKEKADEDNDEGDDEEEEEETGEYGERLLTAFKKLKSMNGKTMKFVVCDARPYCAVAIGKRVGTKQKEELTALTGGSKRFLKPAFCFWDGDQYVFEPEQMVPGLAKKLVRSVKNFTGKKFRMVVGDESAGGEEDELEGGEETEGQDAEGRRPDQTTAREGRPRPEEENPPPGVEIPKEEPGANAAGPEAGQRYAMGEDVPTEAPTEEPSPTEEPPLNMTAPFAISGSVGRGGKNDKADVEAVQAALNKQANAGLKVDGVCGQKTIAAIMAYQKTLGQAGDGRVDVGRGTARALAGLAKPGQAPAPPKPVAPPALGKPELGKAPDIWRGVRGIIGTNIDALKKTIQGHYAQEHPDLIKKIEQSLGKLNVIIENLDHRLADALGKAHAAKDDASRKAELKNAKGIMVEYIKYVKSEPLIAHVDANPFVKIDLKKTITDTLTHMAQSIGT